MGNVRGWDDETAPNFYWGSGALRLATITAMQFSQYKGQQDLIQFVGLRLANIAFPQPRGKTSETKSEPTEPEAPSVT